MAEVVALTRTWFNSLQKKRDGSPQPSEANVVAALRTAPELRGMLHYNDFDDSIEFVKAPPWAQDVRLGTKWSDYHRAQLQVWLQSEGLPIARAGTIQDGVIIVAMDEQYHPLRSQIKNLQWDQVPRLDTWLAKYLGCDGHADYLKAVGRAFAIGAIARLFSPGCKADHVLVLEGPQGIGKSSAVRILSLGYTTDAMPDMHSKDAALQIQGTWINELPELAAMTRSEVEPIKAFLARQVDRYRPPYGRNAIERQRACVFVATTNLHEYLSDETGGRRFWPVRCRHINRAELESDALQIWAEAFWAWIEKEQWHLGEELTNYASEEQDLRRLQTEAELALLEYLDGLLEKGTKSVEMRELLRFAAGIEDLSKQGQQAGAIAKQYSRVLATSGWEKCKATGRHPHRRQPYFYRRPSLTSSQAEIAKDLTSASEPNDTHKHSQADSQALTSDDDDDIPF